MSNIRVLVVEDEGLYRQMLVIALGGAQGIEVVGAAPNGSVAVAMEREFRPDVVVMDVDLGEGLTGVEAAAFMRQANPGLGIVLLADANARHHLQTIRPEEAAGWAYLIKRSMAHLDILIRAIQSAAQGLVVIDPRVNERLQPQQGSRLSRLTQRQQEVLGLVADGYSNAAIARRLFLSEKSVENYLTGIYRELDITRTGGETVHPRVKAVLVYLHETRNASPLASTRM